MIEAELPDGRILEFPAGTSPDVIQKAVKGMLAPPKAEKGYLESLGAGLGAGVGNVALGAQNLVGMGLEKLGATSAGQWLQRDATMGKEKLKGEVAPYKEANPMTAGGGELAGEIVSTLPVGGALAKGVSLIPGAAQKAAPLIQALRTGGFSAGGATGAAGLATRAAGGAATGGASAALINPEDAALGATIGGALPVVGAGVMKGVRAGQRAMRPQEAKVVERLAAQTGMSQDELLSALNQQGPQLIPGYQKTVPQILENDVMSQLQRNLKTAGVNTLGEAERLQQAQFQEALNRVAPVAADVQDAAQRAGGAIQNFALPAREEATKAVRGAFEAIDPEDTTRIMLPIDEMKRAAGQYLGPGTFGTGARAQQAIQAAENVGTEVLPAVEMISEKAAGKAQNLEQAVRAAGGLRGTGGELRDLGIKQSKTTGLVNNKSGKSADLLAESMYQRGFLPDNDPATLIDMLRNGGGRKVFASDAPESGYQRAMEMAMGDAPEATTIAKAVPFNTVQNLRSSIGEAAEAAAAKGANKEAAALREMVGQIDSRINRAAGESVGEGEFFPKEIADKYRDALKLHQEKMTRFETGPQAGMFRKGGDKQASIQGAEIPSRFYSGALSQADDVKAFKRLIGDSEGLARELKSFAMTQGATKVDAQGNLGTQFVKWLAGRSGANKELLTPSELATVNEVGKAVQNQIRTEGLGRVSGSDTAQKLATLQSNGMLDNRLVDILANKTPLVGQFTGPMLQNLRNTAAQTRNKEMARLLSDPEAFSQALTRPETSPALIEALRKTAPAIARTVPVMAAD